MKINYATAVNINKLAEILYYLESHHYVLYDPHCREVMRNAIKKFNKTKKCFFKILKIVKKQNNLSNKKLRNIVNVVTSQFCYCQYKQISEGDFLIPAPITVKEWDTIKDDESKIIELLIKIIENPCELGPYFPNFVLTSKLVGTEI